MVTRQIAKKVSGYLDEFFDLAGKSVRQLLSKIKKDKDHIYIIHSGADFTGDFNSSKIGTGEGRLTNSFRPMGDGLYGYVLDPSDVKEFDRAFTQSAKTYAENFGGRSHIFKIKKEDVKEQIPWTFKKNKLYGSEQDRSMKYDYAVERVGGDEIGGLTEIRVNPEKAIRVSEPQILTQDGKAFRKFDRYINKPSDTRGPAVDLDKFDSWIQKNKPKETYEYRGGRGKTGGGRPVISSKNNRFNKGGNVMAMEQQMEMFGANPMGGLDDDGMSRDPVSGNEIPPGSMANEVRDDVDAKLSDGEYVVPANVVRFFGVKFFEDLRNQAMQGLSAMEANGRIGGEPMPSEMPMQDQMAGAANELTEQDMAMLQGMMNEGGYVQGYNHGGLHDPMTEKPVAQTFSSNTYPINQFLTPGASTVNPAINPNIAVPRTPTTMPVEDPNAAAGFRFVTMVNPARGEIQVVQFKGNVPVDVDAYNSLINAGFFVQGSEELAAYKRKLDEDKGGVGGGPVDDNKAKTLQELINSSINKGISLGPMADIAGGVISKMFPTASAQDVIDFIIKNDGLMPNTGRGIPLKDANGNVVLNAGGTPKFEVYKSGSLKGLVKRAPGKDGEVKLSEAELAYLNIVEKAKKANTDKDGTFNKKGFEIDVLDSNIYNKAKSFEFGPKPKTTAEIIEWYKTQKKKTKTKVVDPVAATSGPAVDKGDGDVTPEGGAIIKPSSGPSSTLSSIPTFLQPDNDNDQGGSGGGPSGPTATQGGGMTGSDDRPDDLRGEGQYGGGSNSQPSSNNNTASSSGPTIGFGGFNMNKGGLIKKPTKKKKTKK